MTSYVVCIVAILDASAQHWSFAWHFGFLSFLLRQDLLPNLYAVLPLSAMFSRLSRDIICCQSPSITPHRAGTPISLQQLNRVLHPHTRKKHSALTKYSNTNEDADVDDNKYIIHKLYSSRAHSLGNNSPMPPHLPRPPLRLPRTTVHPSPSQPRGEQLPVVVRVNDLRLHN